MTRWVRLWEDMPTDPKWRVVARRSGRPISEIVAVFAMMMVRAGQTGGTIEGWNDEDVAAALDMETEHVAAIRGSMQGKTLDGVTLSAWGKRQPKREDDSAERVRAHRERVTHSNAVERDVTQRNAPDTDTDTDTEKVSPPLVPPLAAASNLEPVAEQDIPLFLDRRRGTQLPENWRPSAANSDFAKLKIGDRVPEELAKFRDYWRSVPGAKGRKADWDATWRNWVRRTAETQKGNGHGGNGATNQRFADRQADLRALAETAGRSSDSGPGGTPLPDEAG